MLLKGPGGTWLFRWLLRAEATGGPCSPGPGACPRPQGLCAHTAPDRRCQGAHVTLSCYWGSLDPCFRTFGSVCR